MDSSIYELYQTWALTHDFKNPLEDFFASVCMHTCMVDATTSIGLLDLHKFSTWSMVDALKELG